jgi:alkylation response protein AidB-like acyl-CoA dehydrogenase
VDWSLVRAAEGVLPLLRDNAREAERQRNLPESTIKALEACGLTRMTVPRRLGGLQVSLATEFEVIRTLARACGSTSWVTSLYAVCGYWASLFPDRVQDEVFSDSGARVAGISTPAGTLTPAAGGYVLNGRWPWNTGVLHSSWNVLATLRPHDDGTVEPCLVLVPTKDMTTLDDWDVSAMQGTGSVTSVAEHVFVPADHVLAFLPLLGGDHASESNRGAVEYSYAVLPFLLAASMGTPIGLAQGALESFLERAPKRSTSFENKQPQSTDPVAQFQIGQISMTIEAALAVARSTIAALHRHAVDGTEVTTAERVKVRAVVAYVTRLSADVTTALSRIGGATAFNLDIPGQRHQRDASMLANHALLNYEANLGLLGSVVMGDEPRTPFL